MVQRAKWIRFWIHMVVPDFFSEGYPNDKLVILPFCRLNELAVSRKDQLCWLHRVGNVQ